MNNIDIARILRRSRRAVLTAAAAAALASIAALAPAQTQTPTQTPGDVAAPATQPTTRPVTTSNAGMMLNFQDASIDVVLNELSSAAGFIVVKEVKPEGRVTLISKKPVSPEEAVTLLNTVLRNAGYAAIQQERILKIVNKDVAKRLNIPVHNGNDPEKIPKTDELITQVIPLRFANATQLKTDLQPLVNPEADFASNASSNALVITDTSANVRRVVEIVKSLDTSLADAVDVKVFQLKYANAATTAALINNVFGNLDAARPQPGGGGAPAPGQGGPGGGGFGGGGGGFQRMIQQMQNNQGGKGGKITAGSDERTNSVVVTGPTDTLVVVAQVMKELDANPAAEETLFVYRLRNAQAVNLESVLNSLFNGTTVGTRTQTSNADTLRNARTSNTSRSSQSSRGGSLGSSSGTSGRTGNGGFGSSAGTGFGSTGTTNRNVGGTRLSANAQQAAGDLAGQVTIIADTDSNSILIRTSPANYDRVKVVLDELDKPVAQVLIKVLIAEVTHDDGFDFGAELSTLNLRASTDANGNQLGQRGRTGFGIPTSGAGANGMIVQILESNFTATIRALETAGKLDVLSRPYILASDNQLASITVGQEVPFITNSRITDTGQTINTIEYSDIGILLDVIPHINPDGLVILDVAPEISTLTNSTVPISELVSAPIINKRSALSRVGVRSGQTIVIGGLMEDRVTQTIQKVPLLGDIPLLGELFKRHQSTKTKTELLIFLTPHVAADPNQLPQMGKDEVGGTKLVPNAVNPETYREHQEGLRRGEPAPATRPSGPDINDRRNMTPTRAPENRRESRPDDRGERQPNDNDDQTPDMQQPPVPEQAPDEVPPVRRNEP